jgi:RNA polymerase sigma factor (sigma-70 family)
MMNLQMTEPREKVIQRAVTTYGQRLFRFIRDRVSTNADAEDILQDVWYQFSRVVDLGAIEQVSGWLFRVARNRVTDSYRKQRPALLEDMAYEDEDGDRFLDNSILADFNTPEDEALREVIWEALFEALDELPEAQREVFVKNELEDQTFQQIADETGVNIKTLISRKRYAVQHLRKRLQYLYDDLLEG